MNHALRITAALICAPLSGVKAAEPARPKLLFLVSDDLRPELGCHGNTVIKSANSGHLAKQEWFSIALIASKPCGLPRAPA